MRHAKVVQKSFLYLSKVPGRFRLVKVVQGYAARVHGTARLRTFRNSVTVNQSNNADHLGAHALISLTVMGTVYGPSPSLGIPASHHLAVRIAANCAKPIAQRCGIGEATHVTCWDGSTFCTGIQYGKAPLP